MTVLTLERKLKPFENPVKGSLSKWLYTHLPPRPITGKRMHDHYAKAVGFLMEEAAKEENKVICRDIEDYLSSVVPFVEEYEKKEISIKAATPEEVLEFLMDQHGLNQYDLADDLGGQPVVSDVLNGKRKLTREHIERLSKRFKVQPAVFFPNNR